MDKLSESNRIILVNLYNRLSWYMSAGKWPDFNVKKTMSITELKNSLDVLYEKSLTEPEEPIKPAKSTLHKNTTEQNKSDK